MADQTAAIRPVRAGYLDLSDTILYYREYGAEDAPHTLLLLHGNGESWRCFARQIAPFSEAGYRLITLDSRGHGNSGRGTLPMTPQQLAADALDALSLLEIPRAVPVGFSDGGNIALLMGALRPSAIEALVAAGAKSGSCRRKDECAAALGTAVSSSEIAGPQTSFCRFAGGYYRTDDRSAADSLWRAVTPGLPRIDSRR